MVDVPSYRIFRDRPLPTFVEQVRARLKEHHQPELIPELRHNPIHKDEVFDILGEIEIDPGKRPEQDLAPCPMCQPNKFIRGRLCWFPGLQCCAIIGHCCANKEHNADAEKRYRALSVQQWQEEYFLNALPLIPQKLEIISTVRPKAEEALRLHRKFRKDAHSLMHALRTVAKDFGGRLKVQFEIEQSGAVNEGPINSGALGGAFRRLVDARDYGVLDGQVALRSKYDPVLELNAILAALSSGNVGADEECVMDAVIAMTPSERDRTYAVMSRIDHTQWPAFQRKLEDFCAFFEHDNMQRLARWGRDNHNLDRVEVVDRMLNLGRRQIEIAGRGARTVLSPGPDLSIQIPSWPSVPKH